MAKKEDLVQEDAEMLKELELLKKLEVLEMMDEVRMFAPEEPGPVPARRQEGKKR